MHWHEVALLVQQYLHNPPTAFEVGFVGSPAILYTLIYVLRHGL